MLGAPVARVLGRKQDAVDLASGEGLDVLGLRVRVFVGTDEEDAVTEGARTDFDALHHLGEVRVPDVGNDHADRIARPPAQAPGKDVGPILQFGDRLLHGVRAGPV